MDRIADVAGDIVAAASAIAGLILVYIGALSASFSTFEPQERRTVRGGFQLRAWFAFVGLSISLLALSLALIGKWLNIPCMAIFSLATLIFALFWVLATAVLTVMEIK